MKRVSQLNVRDKIKSFSLSFDNQEFLESVENDMLANPNSNVFGGERRAWLKGKFPTVVDEIDQQLREYFNISKDNKMIFSLYYPPSKINGKFETPATVIKDQKENVFSRIVICTVSEQVEMILGKSRSEKMIMKPWEAYQSPPLIGSILDYSFENKNHMQLEARKGFRSVRKTKKIEDRHILVFDYLISQGDMEKLSEMLTGKKETE